MFEKEELVVCGQAATSIHTKDKKFQLICLPNAGGHIQLLKLNGQEVLDGFANEAEVESNAWGKSGLLYPFPNRLNNGQYEWKEKTYNFPINDQKTGNALHGFGMQRSLKIEEVLVDTSEANIKLSGTYTGDRNYYPWPFEIAVDYRLNLKTGLSVTLSAKNTGKEPMPFGLGWHPYFWLGRKPAVAELSLPRMSKLAVDRRMIPTGSLLGMEDFQEAAAIGKYKVDSGFKLFNPGKRSEAKLRIPGAGSLNYWQDSGPKKFKYLQVFIPPHRNSIALEPMTCGADAFNNSMGLIELKPNASISATCGVHFIPE